MKAFISLTYSTYSNMYILGRNGCYVEFLWSQDVKLNHIVSNPGIFFQIHYLELD